MLGRSVIFRIVVVALFPAHTCALDKEGMRERKEGGKAESIGKERKAERVKER